MFLVRPMVAQEGPLNNTPPKGVTSEEIITRFAAQEKLFKAARDHYTFRQDIKVQTRDGDTVTGEYHEVFDVLYNDKGQRIENVVFAPQSSLEQGGLSLDQGDVQDFRNRLPFVLTSEEVPEYNILYVGQQQQDELEPKHPGGARSLRRHVAEPGGRQDGVRRAREGRHPRQRPHDDDREKQSRHCGRDGPLGDKGGPRENRRALEHFPPKWLPLRRETNAAIQRVRAPF